MADHTQEPSAAPEPSEPSEPSVPGAPADPATTRRALPFGPFGFLVVTAIALAIGVGAGFIAFKMLATNDDATNINDALDNVTFTPDGSNVKGQVKIGDRLPDVSVELLDGSTVQLASVAGDGTPALLNFWSSTCAPCLNEMPTLEEASKKLDGRVVFLGVNTQDTAESGKKMVAKTGVTYANARDPRGSLSKTFGALAIPRTVLVDAKGVVVAMHTGELTDKTLKTLLDENGLPTP